jgi:hypothetical protein
VLACSTNGNQAVASDASSDTTTEVGSAGDGESPDAGDASILDAPGNADGQDASTSAPDGNGGCTLPLSAFDCPATYPATLGAACGDGGYRTNLVTPGTCASLRFLGYGYGAPITSEVCFYDDAGALVGADLVTDTPVCDGSPELNWGDVPATCQDWIFSPDDASVACDGGLAAQNGASD